MCQDGVPVPLPSRRQRAVLASLLVNRDQMVSAPALIAAVWPDDLPESPRAALQTLISRLRHLLGGELIESAPAGYALRAAAGSVDAGRFEDLINRAGGCPPRSAAGLLDEALRLWRGDPFAEFADQDFARAEAVRLAELRLAAIEDRAALAIELGQPAGATAALESLLSGHPFRERARGLLMTALYRQGRPAAALQRYREYRGLLADEIGVDPSPALDELHGQILGHRVGQLGPEPEQVAAPPFWLRPDTSFIGREADTDRLLGAAAEHRAVTVTGTGGVGKTRLVSETLPEVARRLGMGAVVVELAPVGAGEVAAAVARALDLDASAESPRQRLFGYLSLWSGLLVLDNCEHVAAEVRSLVDHILDASPGARVVATSRTRLGVRGERLIPIEPLPVPDAGAATPEVSACPSVRLLVDRVRQSRPHFRLGAGEAAIAAEVCRQVDGVPLGLELAATQATTFGLAAVRDRASELAGGSAALKDLVDWSVRLLEPQAVRLLSVLSVFETSFELAAAEQIATAVGVTAPAACLDALVEASLVEASLVEASLVDASLAGPPAEAPLTVPSAGETGRGGGVARYRLLGMVRAFAADGLAASGDGPGARLAHARWAASVATAAAELAIGPDGTGAFALLDRHRQDLATAGNWALENDRPELAAAMCGAMALCSHWRPDVALLALMARTASDPRVARGSSAALGLGAGGMAALGQGHLEEADQLGSAALTIARLPAERFLALLTLAVTALYRGDHERCRHRIRELLETAGMAAAYRLDAYATLVLIACYQGSLDEARAQVARADAVARAVGPSGYRAFAAYASAEVEVAADGAGATEALQAAIAEADRCAATQVSVVARIALVSVLTRRHEHAAAVNLFPPLLDQLVRLANWPQLWTSLRILAELLAGLDDPETAVLLLAAADGAAGAPATTGPDTDRYATLRLQLDQRIGPDVATALAQVAAELPAPQVVGRALAAIADRPTEDQIGGSSTRTRSQPRM